MTQFDLGFLIGLFFGAGCFVGACVVVTYVGERFGLLEWRRGDE